MAKLREKSCFQVQHEEFERDPSLREPYVQKISSLLQKSKNPILLIFFQNRKNKL
jgi:hypothetical protein